MKKTAKKFPKNLLNMPWKIDYRLRVPVNTDLEINAGHGPVKLSAVEGSVRVSATESETSLTLTGGIRYGNCYGWYDQLFNSRRAVGEAVALTFASLRERSTSISRRVLVAILTQTFYGLAKS